MNDLFMVTCILLRQLGGSIIQLRSWRASLFVLLSIITLIIGALYDSSITGKVILADRTRAIPTMKALLETGYKIRLNVQPGPNVNDYLYGMFSDAEVLHLLYKRVNSSRFETSDTGIVIFGNNTSLQDLIVS